MRAIISILLTFTGAAFAENDALDEANFNSAIYLTTDYVARGVSYSDEDPAIHGICGYTLPFGGSVGIWAGSWDDGGYSNDIWLGYYTGYAGAVSSIDYSFTANYYHYPGAEDDGTELDYIDLVGTIDYTIETALSPAFGTDITNIIICKKITNINGHITTYHE